MTQDNNNTFSKVLNTTAIGSGIGFMFAFNKTFNRGTWVEVNKINPFLRSTYSKMGGFALAGGLIGFSYSATKYFCQDLRGKDDNFNMIAGALSGGVALGILRQSMRLTCYSAIAFAPLVVIIKMMNDEVEHSSQYLTHRYPSENKAKLLLSKKIEEIEEEKKNLSQVIEPKTKTIQ
eukprot:gene2735-3394_t